MSARANRIVLSHGLTGFICWYAVEKVFQKTIGITTLGVSILAVSYIVVSALANIPTGVMADKFGRKYAITFATVALLGSTLVAAVAQNYWYYMISVMLWGLFYSTQNGAYEATLYDTLKEENKQEQYARYSGLLSAVFWVSIFVASIIGAWVGGHYGLRVAYWITVVPNIFNIALALSLHEPSVYQTSEKTRPLAMAKQGYRFITSSQQVLNIAAVYLMLAIIGWTTNEFGQLYFIEIGFAVFLVGVSNAFSGLFQSIGNFVGHRFGTVSKKVIVVTMLLFMTATFLVPLRLRYLGLALFFVLVMLRQIFTISNSAELQHLIPSKIRATTLSSLGMINDGILIIVYLSFGYLSQYRNIRSGYLLVVAYAALLVIVVRLYARSKSGQNLPLSQEVLPGDLPEIDSMPR